MNCSLSFFLPVQQIRDSNLDLVYQEHRSPSPLSVQLELAFWELWVQNISISQHGLLSIAEG